MASRQAKRVKRLYEQGVHLTRVVHPRLYWAAWRAVKQYRATVKGSR